MPQKAEMEQKEELEQEEAELIGSVAKNENTSIQVRKVTYKGQDYFDIREFVDSENYQGPTKKGIRLHSDLLVELSKILEPACA